MKSKTIRKVLNAKISDWIKSIKDANVRALAEENIIVTGGAIVSMLLGETVNDFDLYCRNKETAVALAEYYTKVFNETNKPEIKPVVKVEEDRVKIVVQSSGFAEADKDDSNYKYFETLPEDDIQGDSYVDPVEINKEVLESDDKYKPLFMSSNAITLSGKIQIIIRFYGDPEEILSNYDFVHCTNYWTNSDNNLVLNQDALEAILTKELRYVGSKYPLCSIIRTKKFVNRGFTINAGQYLKMCMQLNELDLKDINVLEDQLTGVDAAYFRQVISYLKANKKDFTTAYICSVIDRIF